MNAERLAGLLRWVPFALLGLLILAFGSLSVQFLTFENIFGILSQSSGIIVITLGMSLVLLSAGVDLSVGSVMYLSAVVVGFGFGHASFATSLCVALISGALVGAANGLLIVGLKLPAFIVTLAMLFIVRGAGLYLSGTRIVSAGTLVAEWGRARWVGVPAPLAVAVVTLGLVLFGLRATALDACVRAIGANSESARRAGVPVDAVLCATYIACGALAGLGGFISFGQTSAASGAFGEHTEFVVIAAAVLGGMSLFGGRGSLWAAPSGAILIATVQNGLVTLDANPYAYPVITGGIIFSAALIDAVRLRAAEWLRRRRPLLE